MISPSLLPPPALLLCSILFCAPDLPGQEADLVLLNGKLRTMDGPVPLATALAVRGNRILAVGPDSAIPAISGPSTRTVDLGGRTVVPGFIESHGHLLGLGYARLRLHLTGAEKYDERVEAGAGAEQAPPA